MRSLTFDFLAVERKGDAVNRWLSDLVPRIVAVEPRAILMGILLAVVLALLVVVVGSMVRWLWRLVLRARVRAEFGLASIPASVRIRPTMHTSEGFMELVFPRWRFANRDGTANRRRSANELVRGPSTLVVGGYRMRSLDPFAIYELARQARASGHIVAWTPEERRKAVALERSRRARGVAANAASIAAFFSDRPTDFEEYCAALLRSLGYRARVTPTVRDGGYDLELEYDGVRYIAECKCFSPTTTVGRPHLQKLVGANVTARAQGLIFVTTARYSRDAREYARVSGIQLIDGSGLADLARSAFGEGQDAHVIQGAPLTAAELWSFYPADARPGG